ncbi:nuclear pore complex protein NUP160 isoform X2 [Mercurialis annua]|uniref:nuclear pore complex protein NUP160 isoform X2 n=1 Tax=Mercurialis annua TaxID=3986 RepID=UPI00215EADEE|nr:nuclear pore complex protein NUP160 isoform X2 [Mercurialis annua]
MANRPMLAGMEVPITGTDSVKWLQLSVPDSHLSTFSATSPPLTYPARDCASCSVIGDPPVYVIWRIHKNLPNAIELLELSTDKESPTIGLRINFFDPLYTFAFICGNQFGPPAYPYLLYALTVAGVAYVFKLKNVSNYTSSLVFQPDEVIEINLHSYFDCSTITSVAATIGCLAIGRNDGSIACFQLGSVDQSAPGFMYELRDDLGINRLWGFMSRSRVAGAVQDLVVHEFCGQKLLFGLYSDGMLKVWDLSGRGKIFNHTIGSPNSEGATYVRLCVGEAAKDSSLIPLAVLYGHNMEDSMPMIHILRLHCVFGDRISLSVESPMQSIPLQEGEFIDFKLASDKLWILKDNGLVFHNLFHTNENEKEARCYALQEEFVAEQLFQNSALSSDDLLSIIYSTFSYSKDHIVPFVSSIFLRRLLHPGVYHNFILRSTLLDYNRHWTDAEFQSLTVGGLKREVCSLIEHEAVGEIPTSMFSSWKHFCARYFHNWCAQNPPSGFLVQSSAGVIGLIRKNSISLFRDVEKIEVLIDGSADEFLDLISFELELANDNTEREILMEVLRCIIIMSQQFGKAASAIFYESIIGTSNISSEDIVPRLLKILETGYSSMVSSFHASNLGRDFALQKEQADHKNLRKFSVKMLFSLHALHNKADSWDKILTIIESYLQFLVPKKVIQKLDAGMSFDINISILVQATSQIAKLMFDSALDVLLFVSYLLNISGQINLLPDEISKIQLELVPMVQEIVFEWSIIHFLCTIPSESPAIEDFSSQLSSLQIDGSTDRRSWNGKLGKCDYTLAFILAVTSQTSSSRDTNEPSSHLPNPENILSLVQNFTSWIIWGQSREESNSFLKRSNELAIILLRHSQYEAVEYLLNIVESNLRREKIYKTIQDTDGNWCVLQHLLGCCLLAQGRYGFQGIMKERKVCEAIRCFFRASSGQGALEALQALSHDAGLPHIGFEGFVSSAAWKLHYYQWAMQLFEQYNIGEGAYQFALAALEQVDEALSQKGSCERELLNESDTSIKGRLWANVFKFTLDLNHLYDAYCAILSNPDEDSKYICLRRFIIVLYERGAMKVLCGGQIPFIGLGEKIEQELVWKAARSDIMTKPNPYKLLYAFEMHRHNWRKAATYMYSYSTRLRTEVVLKDHQHISLVLQERLNGLSATINALRLVHPAYAWIDPLLEENSLNECYPSKKAKKTEDQQFGSDIQPQRPNFYIDVEKVENEFVLTSAQYLLSLVDVKWIFSGTDYAPSDLVDLLVQSNIYDMAFTVLLRFWTGSGLKREFEKIFSAMSLKCCPNTSGFSSAGNDLKNRGLLLTSSNEDVVVHGSPDIGFMSHQFGATMQWETLELYLEKYKAFHAGLPVTVAETLLRTDPWIELPLWLVHMFKDFRRERTWGMTGQESNPASLLRLYVNYGRFMDATNLLLEYMESFASVRPSDLIHRKRPFAAWFPYSTIERLWCQLDELINSGHMVEQCHKLKKLLHGALLNHLKILKVDSDDTLSSAAC